MKANLLIGYETPEGRKGTLRIPIEWKDRTKELFWPNKVLSVQNIEGFDGERVEQLIKVFLRGGR